MKIMKRAIFLLLVLLLISSCNKGEDMNAQEITLNTQDGEEISAKLYRANSDVGVILIHQLGRDKSTYNNFALLLQKNNYNALAVDLRGHGKSSGNIGSFSEGDFNDMKLDVSAALDYLKGLGIQKTFVVGASIGANTAINFGASNPGLAGVVALSPGLDFRGIKPLEAAKKISVPVLIVVSKKDSYAYESSNTLYSYIKSDKELKTYEGAGHGTDMFSSTDMDKVMLGWIKSHV